jgi:glycosyltransferase involved in cell wall biosynthesis
MSTIAAVIPLYNKAPHIAQAIESILTQSRPVDEIIVVDDGSTDGGAEIVKRYVRSHGVRLIQQGNAGESAARNRGIDEAHSDLIAFLDADDIWLPRHIETLNKLVNLYPQAALYSTAHFIKRNDLLYSPRSPFSQGWIGLVDDFFLRYANGLSLVNSITACAWRNRIKEIGGFPLGIRRGPDIICWINLALRHPVAHAEVATAIYNQDGVNRTDRLRETDAPGSLQHISRLLRDDSISLQQRKSLGILFDRIAFFTAAGFKLNGDATGLSAIRDLAKQSNRHVTKFAIDVLKLTPTTVLRYARKFRHPRATGAPIASNVD